MGGTYRESAMKGIDLMDTRIQSSSDIGRAHSVATPGPVLTRIGAACFMMLGLLQTASAHKEPVHQYIAREGYALLIKTYGQDIPELSAFIGPADQSAVGDSAWQKGFITTGAWREDAEDVVYHYDILPGLNYALTSITHFWSADRGDATENMIRLQIERPPLPPVSTYIGPYPNAFARMMKFVDGGWVLNYPRSIVCRNVANNHWLVIAPLVSAADFGVPLSYDGLTTFYATRRLTVRAEQRNLCAAWDLNDLASIQLAEISEIEVGEDVRNTVTWEILGRMCHLLADMSVPAHAHLDEHGLQPDSYENYIGGPGEPYKVWTADTVGSPILPQGSAREVVHHLMYTMQQQADHFGSNGPANGNGNDNLGGDLTPDEQSVLTGIDLSSLGGPTTDAGPWSTADLDIIRDATFPYAIRATAGLMYWFCVSTGIIQPIVSVPAGGEPTLPEVARLEQNYPNPFNPLTRIGYSLGHSGLVTLRVYNTLGEEVATLVNAEMKAGRYEVSFDARGLPSGVYFVRLQAQGLSVAKRMMLLM